jgi:hypothetical protein
MPRKNRRALIPNPALEQHRKQVAALRNTVASYSDCNPSKAELASYVRVEELLLAVEEQRHRDAENAELGRRVRAAGGNRRNPSAVTPAAFAATVAERHWPGRTKDRAVRDAARHHRIHRTKGYELLRDYERSRPTPF